jgi:hypothetical protein
MRPPKLAAVLLAASLLTVASCSSDSSDDTSSDQTTTTAADDGDTTATTGAVERPDGPAADVSQELTGGNGVMLAAADGAAFEAPGWVEQEFAAAGTAVRYTAEGDLPTDGSWELTEGEDADYRTRIVVRRPEQAEDFNGTVVVEWLNVSGGLDANPDFSFMEAELLRGGYAWVGVSAQHIGIEGGPVAVGVSAGEGVAGKGLKVIDPERYGDLSHPGDAFSYDIYTQIARALRADGASGVLGDLEPERLLAVGESQSGFALTSYANGVQPLARQFDGILIHSRGGAAAPLGEPDAGIDIAGTIGGAPTTVRTDLDVPVLILQTEGDVVGILNYFPARQDDTEMIRLWEVAGAAHADRFLVGPLGDSLGCPLPVNDGPQRFVVRRGLRALDAWVRTGEAPPAAERLETTTGADGAPAYLRNDLGIATGGIRTPLVDVPVDVLSGSPSPNSSVICILFGSTSPLTSEQLAGMYPSASEYLAAFEQSADAAIEAGFVLEEDREELLDMAQPARIGA